MDVLDRLAIDVPVVQAGMGGGLSRSRLAGAVSAAGALGTVGILPPPMLRTEVEATRDMAPGRGFAVNLLMPFVTREHVDVCVESKPRVVVLFCGYDTEVVARLRDAGIVVLHQVGDAAAAKRALHDGADGVVVQGSEAGGHVLAVRPLAQTLPEVIAAAGDRPVLAAGGMVGADDVRAAVAAGAAGVVAGTRFLLTDECHAHPEYKRRVLGAGDTVITTLFALGWRDPHRVVPNAAVRRWCGDSGAAKTLPRVVAAALLPLARRVPMSAAGRLVERQRVGLPLFSPAAMLEGDDPSLAETTPLYAGAGAARIDAVIPAAEAVRRLTP